MGALGEQDCRLELAGCVTAISPTPWPVTLLAHHKLSEGGPDTPYLSPAREQWLLF